mmetsp:Transcript_47967/g.124548  ORF Transcript_47967/g.124548 Transcript_47967/m.124548 type:complete len:82 (-) Transcript_47967:880-1125(-)
MTAILSAVCDVVSRCVIMMTVFPSISVLIDADTAFSLSGSRAEVGSSKHRIGASRRNALAIAILCFCPPLRLVPLGPITVW